jgi:predicted Zn-dependent protease
MKYLFIALSVFIFFLVTGCSTSPTGRSQLAFLPDSQIDSMGIQSFQQMKSNVPPDLNASDNTLVKCVANLITTANENKLGKRNWEVVVFKSDEINAFALPGAKIGVYGGLLKVTKTSGQLAAVIGHEVGHVLARHGNERVSEELLAKGGLILADGALKDNKYRDLIIAGLGAGAEVGILLPFNRIQESEADAIGLDFMARAGFDPREAIKLWHNMSAVGGRKPPQWLSDHPSDSARIEALEKLLPTEIPIYNASLYRKQAATCSR